MAHSENKWFTYTQALKPDAISIPFDREKTLPVDNYKAEVLCITQNETSNGTQVNMETLRQLRKKNPDSLLAIDATSSMGGQALDFSLGDIWFASAQKMLWFTSRVCRNDMLAPWRFTGTTNTRMRAL
jgi:phosphoserine aminotransferase